MIAFSQLIGNNASLQDSSVVRETTFPFPTEPAVGGGEDAVDPITQGAVQWVNECAEA